MRPRSDAIPSRQVACSPSRESPSGRPSLRLELAFWPYRTTELTGSTELQNLRRPFAVSLVLAFRCGHRHLAPQMRGHLAEFASHLQTRHLGDFLEFVRSYLQELEKADLKFFLRHGPLLSVDILLLDTLDWTLSLKRERVSVQLGQSYTSNGRVQFKPQTDPTSR